MAMLSERTAWFFFMYICDLLLCAITGKNTPIPACFFFVLKSANICKEKNTKSAEKYIAIVQMVQYNKKVN